MNSYKWYQTILPRIAIALGGIDILCLLVFWEQSDILHKVGGIVYLVLAVVCYKESKRKAIELKGLVKQSVNKW